VYGFLPVSSLLESEGTMLILVKKRAYRDCKEQWVCLTPLYRNPRAPASGLDDAVALPSTREIALTNDYSKLQGKKRRGIRHGSDN
jgi:hypothetical protein